MTLPVPPSAVHFESALKKLYLFSSSLHSAAITVCKCLKQIQHVALVVFIHITTFEMLVVWLLREGG